MTTRVISLGYRCGTTYQIRKLFRQVRPYPFDWIVTPLHSIEPMIRDDFRLIAEPDDLHLVENMPGTQTIYHRTYDVLLHHEFERLPSNWNVIDPLWRTTILQVAAKWRAVAANLTAALSMSDRILFVRYGPDITLPVESWAPATVEDVNRLYAFLSSLRPNADTYLLVIDCVTTAEGFSEGILSGHVALPTAGAAAATQWQGNHESWEELLRNTCKSLDWPEGHLR